jgi:hypothetical protein
MNGALKGPGLSMPSARASCASRAYARKTVLGWCRRCKLARALKLEYAYKRLKLAQLLGQLGVFLTAGRHCHSPRPLAANGCHSL